MLSCHVRTHPLSCSDPFPQDTLLACEQAGVALATEVRKVQRRRETGVVANAARQTAASQAQLAMGRVVGPLCVVTAR